MHIDLSQVNWLAVVVAGLAAFFLGGLWYTALFGKAWVGLMGYSEQKIAELKARMSPPKFFGGMVIAYVVLAVAVELLVVALDLRGAGAGATLGAILWFGPAAAIAFTSHLASDRRLGIYIIDAAFQFVCLVTQGIILASWR